MLIIILYHVWSVKWNKNRQNYTSHGKIKIWKYIYGKILFCLTAIYPIRLNNANLLVYTCIKQDNIWIIIYFFLIKPGTCIKWPGHKCSMWGQKVRYVSKMRLCRNPPQLTTKLLKYCNFVQEERNWCMLSKYRWIGTQLWTVPSL